MSSYVNELIKAQKVYEMNDQKTIITDRMGSWEEQCVTLTWEGNPDGKIGKDTISVTPDEVEVLFAEGLVTNVVRGENGKLYEKWCYADICQYDGAIVCGILAPSKQADLRQEIIDYAKKMGYVTDRMTPVKMTSGTKSLIFNDDENYSISFRFDDNIIEKIDRKLLCEFTKNFFWQQKVKLKDDVVLMPNLSEDETFSRENIDMFRKYDIQLFYLQPQFDKILLLQAVMQRAFVEDFPCNILGRERFKRKIIPNSMKIAMNGQWYLKLNEFGPCDLKSGIVYYDDLWDRESYVYQITVPYTKCIRELMINATKVLKEEYGKKVYATFKEVYQKIDIYCEHNLGTHIERDLISLDYAITFLQEEENFNKWQLYDSILDLLEMDSRRKFEKEYFSYLKILKAALPEKAERMW